MKEASNIKWPKGLKRTKTRESVLSVLMDSHCPLSALEIFLEVEDRGESIWLSTVYRALDAFIEKGIVSKTSILDNEIALYDINHPGHKHYAICVECHKIIAMENCPMDDFKPKFKEDDIEILGHKVEIYGYCKDCK